jgi:thiol-disulfide isomerase/thioredoxin
LRVRRSRTLLLSVLVCVALVACTSAGGGSGRAGGPLDASFFKLDGTQSSFATYRGTPVVVNFFSSTCVPCVTEMPALQKLHEQIGDKVAFLGMDVQDTVPSATAFVATVKVTWDIGRDPDGSILQKQLGGVGMPTTAVLDRDGNVVQKWLGQVDIAELTQVLKDKGFA